MTKLEEAEMQELGMTPEKLKAKRDEIAALLQEETTRPTKPPRKPRSDKGVPKPKKATVAGVLNEAQITKLRELMEAREQALQANTEAENAMLKACADFDAYLDSLTAK